MFETDAAGTETGSLDTPEALRTLAARAKLFAEALPNGLDRQRIIANALRLEAEAAMLEQPLRRSS